MSYVNYSTLRTVSEAAMWNVRDDLKEGTIDDVRAAQEACSLPFAVCALNITGDLNVGMMMRTACIFGAERFIIFGRRVYDRRTTVGAQNYMNLDRVDGMKTETEIDPAVFSRYMAENNYVPIFCETGGVDYRDIDFKTKPDGRKPCLVFGNEGFGISDSVINSTPERIIATIPQRGVLRSLNVSTACAILVNHAALELTTKEC